MSTTSYIGRKVKLTEEYIKLRPSYVKNGKNEGVVQDDEQGNTRAAWVIEMDNGQGGLLWGPEHPRAECILLDEESIDSTVVPKSAVDNHTILDTAKGLIYGDREKEYGKAIDNIGNIAKMWSILLQKEITMEQVVECMIAVKQCRLINQPNHMDSWIDICGYAALKEKINKGL